VQSSKERRTTLLEVLLVARALGLDIVDEQGVGQGLEGHSRSQISANSAVVNLMQSEVALAS
jgi:hypothetical protein